MPFGAMVKGQSVTLDTAHSFPSFIRTATMVRILIDRTLTEYADQAFLVTRLRRNGIDTTPNLVSAETLAELEASGDAMRFVDTNGRIAWKATPKLRNYVIDLQFDAQNDLQDI